MNVRSGAQRASQLSFLGFEMRLSVMNAAMPTLSRMKETALGPGVIREITEITIKYKKEKFNIMKHLYHFI